MRTLEGLTIDFPTLGWDAADWIETYCVFGPGDVQGQPAKLADDFVRFLAWAYRLDPITGRRLITDADILGPKGWAKSQLAGWIVCFEALGPCRFDGWGAGKDDFDNRLPIGRPIVSPFIRCLATEEDQSGNTYDNVYDSLTEGEAANVYALDAGLTKTYIKEPGGGEIRPSTSGDVSKDGGKETFGVGDETHLYVLPGTQRMYRTVERNMPKRKLAEPWFMRTSTAWEPGEGSIAEQNWEEFEAVGCDVERAIQELGLLVDHREAPEIVITKDHKRREEEDANLREALNELYGEAAAWVDIERIIRRHFRRPGADLADARRYYLNQRVKATGKWMDKDDWGKLACSDQLQPGDQIALGFDGSRTKDATGLVACRLRDGLLVSLLLEERPRNLARWKPWEVNDQKVHAAVEAAFLTYRVEWMLADPHWWRQEVDTWHGRWGKVVVPFDTSKTTRMVYAVDRFEKDVDTGAVKHTGDNDLTRHVLNAYAVKTRVVLEVDGDDQERNGKVLAKETRDSTDHIDLAMGAVLANHAKGYAIADGALGRDVPSEVVFL